MALGGWDRRYARVLDVGVQGDVAAALVDVQGDGRELNVDVYTRQLDGGWECFASGNGSMGIPGGFAVHTADDRIHFSRDPDDEHESTGRPDAR